MDYVLRWSMVQDVGAACLGLGAGLDRSTHRHRKLRQDYRQPKFAVVVLELGAERVKSRRVHMDGEDVGVPVGRKQRDELLAELATIVY